MERSLEPHAVEPHAVACDAARLSAETSSGLASVTNSRRATHLYVSCGRGASAQPMSGLREGEGSIAGDESVRGRGLRPRLAFVL